MSTAALDPSYAEAAARKAVSASGEGRGTGAGAPRRPRRRLLTLLLVTVGLATGVAAAQVRNHADGARSVRNSLVTQVQRQTGATDHLATTAAALRREVQTERAQLLGEGSRGRAVSANLTALEQLSGEVPVHGPGLVVTLDDAKDAAATSATDRGGQLGNGRIYDRDVQDVANALWAAGAEAISINGQRLVAGTAIRSAGEAVLVDFRPLSPPYVLRAIGNVGAMDPAFGDSATARRFTTWISLYGLGFQVRRADDLRLAAGGAPALRLARPVAQP